MSYNVGDIVNGHVLGSDNQWHPVATGVTTATLNPAAPPMPDAKPKPFYRRWWFIGATGLAVLAIVGSAAGGKGGASSTASAGPAAAPAQSPAAPAAPAPSATTAPEVQPYVPGAPEAATPAVDLNTPVRDGKFEFTVTNVSCGKTQIGGQYLNKKAQGQFCLVTMSVTNIGTKSQMFSGSNQKAIDGQGRELEADGSAAMYLEDSKSFLEDINPGNSVKGTVVFDVPKTSTITQLELHDSMFSSGVKVNVA